MGKRALCVGVNYPGQEYQLYGCVNDCLDWERMLKEAYEFEETRVLIDQYPDGTPTESGAQLPTRANILAQLGGWLVAGAQPGDVLVFVFAGHGCQVRTNERELEEALVPGDYRDSSALILRDEVHALMARLPSGCYITMILDCCHGAHMLDVPCSVDTSTGPFTVHQTTARPQEVSRTHEAWMLAYVDHARSRPRFIPTVTASGRTKRSPEGAGAHVGRMTLNPGVTAFCLAAARPFENARDANIKTYQCGVLTFCIHQALQDLQYRCTFEQLLERAAWKMEDIRNKYMRMMDQTIQMSFCPNSAPSAVVVFDARYAPVAQHRISQLAQQQNMSPPENLRSPGAPSPEPVRQASTEFVPSPGYREQPDTNAVGGEVVGVGIVYVQLFSCSDLRPQGMYGQCDPYVKMTCGGVTHQSTVKRNSTHPTWGDEENKFTFKASDCQVEMLFIEVRNAGRDELIGRVDVPLRSLPSMTWEERRQFLQNGGEVEFRVALYPERAAANLRPQPGLGMGLGGPMGPMEQQPPPAGTGYPEKPRPPSPPARDLGPSLMGEYDLRAPMERRPMDEEPLLENIFGKPNLFAAMPDLMSQLSTNAPTGFHEVLPAIPQVGGLSTPALGGLGTPVSGLPAPASAMPAPAAAPATSRLGVASYTPPPAACFTPPSLVPTAEVGRTASRGLSLEGYYSTGGMAAAKMNTASTAVPTPQVPGSYTYSTPSPFTYSQAQPGQSALGSNLNAASYPYSSSGTPFTGYSQQIISGQTSQSALGTDLASYTYTAPSYTTSAAPASLTSYTPQGQIIGTTAQKALNADLSAGAYTYTSAPTALFTGYSQPGQSTGAYGARLATPSYQPPYQVLS